MLRSRRSRREEPFGVRLPEPVVGPEEGNDPEHEALLADSVGLALLVVLDTLEPAERLAFVLHDMFAVPFDEIAPLVGRSPAAARKLASRARRRVQGAATVSDADATVSDADAARQRELVGAFLAAARGGDIDALLAVLDPDVVVRSDIAPMGASGVVRGAATVAEQALAFSRRAQFARRALVNGTPGLVAVAHGRPLAVLAFTIARGRIVEVDIVSDPARLRQLDLAGLDG
jgi:RNA polymerase sigma-70 factor (ECF subfamily)